MSARAQVAEWAMEPIPGYDCKATFFDDGTAEFFDEPARHRDYDSGSRVRKLAFMMFSEEDRHLSDEVCRYSHPFKVSPSLLTKILSATGKIDIGDDGEILSDISHEEEKEIDKELNLIFWRDINWLLTVPLDSSDGGCTSEDR